MLMPQNVCTATTPNTVPASSSAPYPMAPKAIHNIS